MSPRPRLRLATVLIQSRGRLILLFVGCVFGIGSRTGRAQFAVLHAFGPDNQSPYALTISSAGQLIGATEYGTSNVGSIFTMDLNGGNVQTIHTFTGGPTDGAFPQDLLEYHSVLYGLTEGQGVGDLGSVLFRTDLDGSNYQVLRVFDNNPAGSGILGTLSTDGTSLYGTTYYSQFGGGTIYRVGLDGSNFMVLHSFDALSGDGGNRPLDGVTVAQSKLFGITEWGGAASNGTLYTLDGGGTGFKTLHSFSGGTNDGAVPEGAPLPLGSKLYGTTLEGGEFDHGTVYCMNADGTDYQILHSFQPGDGVQLETSLVTDGTTLYGVAKLGGAGSLSGTIFSLAPDGSSFQVLHALTGSDGFQPSYPPTYYQGTLYGTTLTGGVEGGGTVFDVFVPEPTTVSFLLPAILALAVRRRVTRRILTNCP